jgi:hypothetical protein
MTLDGERDRSPPLGLLALPRRLATEEPDVVMNMKNPEEQVAKRVCPTTGRKRSRAVVSIVHCPTCGPKGVVVVSDLNQETLVCEGCGRTWHFERSP